ncbi:hypothetical protein [Povalibacter sp.]|uniref:hypothetical protein n=1 Tax=Povalibacter sp. TaxID=1962978 RepID=UPI002F3F4B67
MPSSARTAVDQLQKLIEGSILGQQYLIRSMIIGVLADGHLLLESQRGSREDPRCEEPGAEPRCADAPHSVHSRLAASRHHRH